MVGNFINVHFKGIRFCFIFINKYCSQLPGLRIPEQRYYSTGACKIPLLSCFLLVLSPLYPFISHSAKHNTLLRARDLWPTSPEKPPTSSPGTAQTLHLPHSNRLVFQTLIKQDINPGTSPFSLKSLSSLNTLTNIFPNLLKVQIRIQTKSSRFLSWDLKNSISTIHFIKTNKQRNKHKHKPPGTLY